MDPLTLGSIQDSIGLQVSIDEVTTMLCKWYTIKGADGQRLAHIETDRAFPSDPWRPARIWAGFQAVNAEDVWTMAKLAEHVLGVAQNWEDARKEQGHADAAWSARNYHGAINSIMVGDVIVERDSDVAHVVVLPLSSKVITSTGVEFSTEWGGPLLVGLGSLYRVGADRLKDAPAKAYRFKTPTE